VEQIAGLMLYSRHQFIPNSVKGIFAGTCNENLFTESGTRDDDITGKQK